MAEAFVPCATLYYFDANEITPEIENYVNNEMEFKETLTYCLRDLQPLS